MTWLLFFKIKYKQNTKQYSTVSEATGQTNLIPNAVFSQMYLFFFNLPDMCRNKLFLYFHVGTILGLFLPVGYCYNSERVTGNPCGFMLSGTWLSFWW